MPARRSLLALCVLAILATVAWIGWFRPVPPPKLAGRPECPEGGDWGSVFAPKHTDRSDPFGHLPNGEVPLSGDTTNIIEYHDCQQFIVEDSTSHSLRYSSLFAIFARSKLDSVYKPPRPAPADFDSLTWGIPMATIFSYDSAYTRLGIKAGFSCLYLVRQTPTLPAEWRARVVPVGRQPELCKKPLPPKSTSGRELTVTTVQYANGAADDSPPVARWDWDEVNRLQYIGIRCGAAWCEVHPSMDTGHAFSSSAPLTGLEHVSKGWYDEQLLTVASGATGARPQVSDIKASFIPHGRLGEQSGDPNVSRFANQWMPVGNILIRANPGGYESKLNLINAGEDTAENSVSLCYSTLATPNKCFTSTNVGTALAPTDCKEQWYGRIAHHARGSTPEKIDYFCVIRREHDKPGMSTALHIPGVVRWRWMLDDETIWVRCLQGCCEVTPHL